MTTPDTIKALRDALKSARFAIVQAWGAKSTALPELDAALALTADASEDALDARHKLIPMQNDEGKRGWYFDSDEFYIDIDLEDDGTHTVYFRNRKDGTHQLYEPYVDPAARPAPVAATPAPDLWQLVPTTLTDDMIIAFMEAWVMKVRCIDDPEMDDAYAAMLAAATAAPAESNCNMQNLHSPIKRTRANIAQVATATPASADSAADARDAWISVEDQLPEEFARVLAVVGGQVGIGFWYDHNNGRRGYSFNGTATMGNRLEFRIWQPLPSPPIAAIQAQAGDAWEGGGRA